MRTEIIKMENSSSCEIDLIEVRDGQAVTSSLVVAKYFGKAHKDVLRAINHWIVVSYLTSAILRPLNMSIKKVKKDPCTI